jgi:hypothetical protein
MATKQKQKQKPTPTPTPVEPAPGDPGFWEFFQNKLPK